MVKMNCEPMHADSEPGLLATMLYPLAHCWTQRGDSVSMFRERYEKLRNLQTKKVSDLLYIYLLF